MAGLSSWITRRAQRTPDAIALVDATTGVTTTYAQLAVNSARRAAALSARGVRRGDRVMLLGLNSTAQLETMFAVARLAAITVPVNFRLSAGEVAYLISDAAPTVLLHDDMFADLAAAAAEQAPRRLDVAHIDALDVPEEAFAPENPVHADDVAMLMYTSGTTGKPKGAMLTHGNFEWNAINMLVSGEGMTPRDKTLAVAPLFHIGGLSLYVLPLMYAGGTIVVAPAFDPAATLKLLEAHRITVHFMVPAMWDAMRRVPTFDDHDLSSLRTLLCGGAPCPIPVIDFYQGKGMTFMEGFGMTELAPAAIILEAEYVRSHAGSVGRPIFHDDVRIVDGDDKDVPTGEVGELLLTGPNVFAGYWGLPEVTAHDMRGGWFHSGDLARMDADGFITLVDRKKDMIVTGGENVYPIEVEQVLLQHPDVEDAAVIGLPDEKWGEGVTAVVSVRAEASVSADDLLAFCRDRIAHFKSPRRIEFLDVLPRNATGKLLKRTLREQFGSDGSAVTR